MAICKLVESLKIIISQNILKMKITLMIKFKVAELVQLISYHQKTVLIALILVAIIIIIICKYKTRIIKFKLLKNLKISKNKIKDPFLILKCCSFKKN